MTLYRLTAAALAATMAAGAAAYDRTVMAVEYYNAARDHYFITSLGTDIYALDYGLHPGWTRTGQTFPVSPQPYGVLVVEPVGEWDYPGVVYVPLQAVCRFYLPPQFGDSHFFTASLAECREVQLRFQGFVLESTAAFHVLLPDTHSGACPQNYPTKPVFRLWNARADTNHRYVTSLVIREAMMAEGWVVEGHGSWGVAFCAPMQ
jgi:hypothetical protein